MKMRTSFTLLLFMILFCCPVLVTSQTIGESFLTVDGEVLHPIKLHLEDMLKMEQVEVKTTGMQGVEKVHQGVRLLDILKLAGVTLGKELRGENLTKYLLLTAMDGYEVIYALAEVDTEFTDQTIILAYKVDGFPLPAGEGPFRIIAPSDKRPARWIRELSSIKVLFSKQ
jgi:DMSO/TMAO reductase YedYZ molybdopterin-dependent catalytic subunit